MKKLTTLILGTGLLMGSFSAAIAQPVVHQVLFANEGWYDYGSRTLKVKPTIGSYNPVTKVYTVVDTIQGANFTSDIIVDGNYFYVAADTFLLQYDITTYQLVNKVAVKGIRNLATWNNQILVSRGDTIALKSYLQVFDKNTLAFNYELDTLTGPKYGAAGIAIYNNMAYVAINAFSRVPVGKIGIVNLSGQTYSNEIDLGPNGINPENVMQKGGMIYTLNNTSWTSSAISAFNTSDLSHNSVQVSGTTSCGTSTKALNFVYYQTFAANTIERFDVSTMAQYDTLNTTIAYYGMLDDTVNGQMYITSTDYVSKGEAYITNYKAVATDSFKVGINPGAMALDVRNVNAVKEVKASLSLSVYPNPTASMVNVKLGGTQAIQKYTITNVLGEVMQSSPVVGNKNSMTLNIANYPSGVYLLNVEATDGSLIQQKIVKQ